MIICLHRTWRAKLEYQGQQPSLIRPLRHRNDRLQEYLIEALVVTTSQRSYNIALITNGDPKIILRISSELMLSIVLSLSVTRTTASSARDVAAVSAKALIIRN